MKNDWIFIEFSFPLIGDAFCLLFTTASGTVVPWTVDLYASSIECQ